MAVYKVAQDVEADDKLLGPFTARQFIYLIIVALAGLLSWFLGNLLLPLFIIPLPVVLFFGALALPLRKDQPMEVYMAAMVSYYLKPRRRLWIPDGIESLVEIIAPRVDEAIVTKGFTQAEAEQRLSYLADIVDTEGWAVRHAIAQEQQGTSMISDVYNDARATQDPLDTESSVGISFESMISEADEKRRQDIIARMHNPTPTPQPAPTYSDPYAGLAQPQQDMPSDIHFNPYPTIHQSVIQPLNADHQVTTPPIAAPEPQTQPQASPVTDTPTESDSPESTSETKVSPDIIKLVSNSDLSIETIAREAHRIQEKDDGNEEVVISLR